MTAIADKGSTLDAVSWSILGVLAFFAFVVVCVVLPIWRQVHDANVERRRIGGWCPACNGFGEVDTGRREYDTGGVITAKCLRCNGTGKRMTS